MILRPFEEESLFTSFTINLTNKCNIFCSYCSRESSSSNQQKLSFAITKRILEYFCILNNEQKPLFVQFTGGEIFTHDKIFDILKMSLDLGYVVRIQTNGTLLRNLRPSELEILKTPRIIFKVSLDGWNRETHGVFRGENTFSSAVKGIGILKNLGSKFGLKTVVHESNLGSLNKMLDFCLHVESNGWSYNTLILQGRSKKNGVDEMAVVKKLVPLYNTPKYRKLLNGSNILIYYQFLKQGLSSWPPYLYFNCDGIVSITDKILPERVVGTFKDASLNDLDRICANSSEIISKVRRPMNAEVLKFIGKNLIL